MKSFGKIAILSVCLMGYAMAADSRVYFGNNTGVFSPPRLVVFNGFWGSGLSGTGVRSGVGGRTFQAQLIYYDSGLPVGPPAKFLSVQSAAGTWRGGMLTLPGVAPGTPVTLQVVVTDTAVPTIPLGKSQPFQYAQKVLIPAPLDGSDYFMDGFQGFEISTRGSGSVVVVPTVPCPPTTGPVTIALNENGAASLPATVDPLTAELLRNAPESLALGAWSGVHPAMVFQAKPGFYGQRDFTTAYALSTDTYCTQSITFDVAPATERLGPRLQVLVGSPLTVTLFGLTNRKYQVEISADLKTWAMFGNIQGTLAPKSLNLQSALDGLGSKTGFYVRALNPTNSP